MPLRSQQQVMVHLDRMSGRAMRRQDVRKAYVEETLGPLVEAIQNASDGREALRRLGAPLFYRMNTKAVEDAVADVHVQAGLIGRVSAMPKAENTNQKAAIGG